MGPKENHPGKGHGRARHLGQQCTQTQLTSLRAEKKKGKSLRAGAAGIRIGKRTPSLMANRKDPKTLNKKSKMAEVKRGSGEVETKKQHCLCCGAGELSGAGKKRGKFAGHF